MTGVIFVLPAKRIGATAAIVINSNFFIFVFLSYFKKVFPFMNVGPIVTSEGKIPVLR